MYSLNPAGIIATTIVLSILATATVIIRLTQTRQSRTSNSGSKFDVHTLFGLYAEDVFCIIALVLSYPISAIMIWGAAKGSVGGHTSADEIASWYEVATPSWVTMAQVFWVVFFLQPIVLGCIKISIICFYRRIFPSRAFNITSWIMISLVAAWMFAFSIGLFFDCGTKLDANWDSLGEIAEQCPFGFLPTIVYTILDACFDFFVLILPQPWIFGLQMPMKKKVSVVGCFMLGGIATAAAFVRMTIFIQSGIPQQVMTVTSVMGYPAYDVLGIVTGEVFWTMVETNVGLVAVSLPAIRRIVRMTSFSHNLGLSSLRRYLRSMIPTSNSTKGYTTKGSRIADHDVELGNVKQGSTVELSSKNATFFLTQSSTSEKRSIELDPRIDADKMYFSHFKAHAERVPRREVGIHHIDEVIITCDNCGHGNK